MAKFRKKPVEIEAISFDDFVEYGKNNGGNIVDGMPWSFHYKGHAVTHENATTYLIPTHQGTVAFSQGDMLITQFDGEIYPCKGDLFKQLYESVPVNAGQNPETLSLSFGEAVAAAKKGMAIYREGWNGSGMFAYIVPANEFPALTGIAKEYFGKNANVPYREYWALKTAQNDIATWAPSGSDTLAEDWHVIDKIHPLKEN